MGTKLRPSSLQLPNKGVHNLGDRINMLPDDILILVLSQLSLKEAAITSVLSRRWRHLWAFITCLDFDATKTLIKVKISRNWNFRETERNSYASWVNHVVGLHKGPTIELFKVSFDLDQRFQSNIDKWVKFALARGVRSLVLDFSMNANSEGTRPRAMCYTFPFKMLCEVKGTSLKSLSSNSSIIRHCSFVSLKPLKALCFKCVNVSGDVIECFLSSCPVLERLSVHGSRELKRFKVIGPSVVLKYLKITYCHDIESIEISNVNLIALIYKGRSLSLLLENVPQLVELYIGGSICLYPNYFFPLFSSCLSQLESLELRTSDYDEVLATEFNLSSKLTSLKKLTLRSDALGDICMLGYTYLIQASPNLQKFVILIEWMSPSIDRRKVRKATRVPHQHLEEVEFAGYYGRKSDVELVIYFLENAVALKKLVVHPHDQSSAPLRTDVKEEKAAKVRAKQQLKGKVPASIEFVIL